jgi:hypothetical protein
VSHTYKFTVSVQHDSTLPRDAIVNTLYFRNSALGADLPIVGTDLDALADDLASVFQGNWYGASPLRRITVKAYDTEGAPPHRPQSTRVKNDTALAVTVSYPSEIALCLSFKGGPERWQRGRIYLPANLAVNWTSASTLSARPQSGMITQALNLADALSGLGGPNIDWMVHSADHPDSKVTEAWVDDEWDTQRRRGLKATTRTIRSQSG